MLWAAVLALLIAVVAVAAYRLTPSPDDVAVVRVSFDPACDLRAGPCTVSLPGDAQVTFAIEPRDIPVVERLSIAVETSGLAARACEVDFSGVDMNMGYNRIRLEPTASGSFAGVGMLPVCVRKRMTWEANVLIDTPSGLIAAPFRFDTYRPGSGRGKDDG